MRQYVPLIIIGLLLAACAGETPPPPPTPTLTPVVVVFATEEPPTPTPSPAATPTPSPLPSPAPTVGVGADSQRTPAPSSLPTNRPPDINPLTGLKVEAPATLQRRPLMVRIGNDLAARPQVALDKADIVYEEITEWWITRFTAIYLTEDPEIIAPIRSARLINLQLTTQYDGVLVSSGGSDGVRWELSESDIINLDEFFVPDPFFYREDESWLTRLAFDATAAREYLAEEGLEQDAALRGFVFSPELDLDNLPPDAVGEANSVNLPYPPATSATTWTYDPASGQYLRYIVDEPLTNYEGEQITASNVIIYFADHQPTDIVEDSNGATSIRIIINGVGTAWLLRDGKVLKGNWKTDGFHTPEFIFNDGSPMPLKPGQSWVELLPLEYSVEIDGIIQTRLGEEAEETPTTTAEPTATGPTPTFTPIGSRPTVTPTP